MFPAVLPAEGVPHGTVLPDGSVISQVTAPVGATATPYPVTTVVRVVGRPSCGLEEAVSVMPGVCLKIVRVVVELTTAT